MTIFRLKKPKYGPALPNSLDKILSRCYAVRSESSSFSRETWWVRPDRPSGLRGTRATSCVEFRLRLEILTGPARGTHRFGETRTMAPQFLREKPHRSSHGRLGGVHSVMTRKGPRRTDPISQDISGSGWNRPSIGSARRPASADRATQRLQIVPGKIFPSHRKETDWTFTTSLAYETDRVRVSVKKHDTKPYRRETGNRKGDRHVERPEAR